MRIKVDPDAVRSAVATYLATSDPEPPEAVAAARQHGLLPFWKDMGGCLLLRDDGEILTFGWDSGDRIEAVEDTPNDRALVHAARGAATRRFPSIRGLQPERDTDARTCPGCGGSGTLPNVPENIVCQCGGLGWLPADVV